MNKFQVYPFSRWPPFRRTILLWYVEQLCKVELLLEEEVLLHVLMMTLWVAALSAAEEPVDLLA